MGNAKLKQTKNLFNSLSQDEFSVFYATDKIPRSLLNKAKKSFYSKDKLFLRSYNESENENDLYIRNYKVYLPIHNPFVEQIKYIDCSTLFTIKEPSDLLHANIARTKFLGKSAVDPEYCLSFDLFTSKIYSCLRKKETF